jgi:hypothetical protein
VVAGAIRCRQRILSVEEGMWDDQTPCAEIHVDSRLVAVEPRLMRPFQGWRYLEAKDAPPDAPDDPSGTGLPARLLQELRVLGLG